MEVKAGYKQTEIGIIPEEWDENQLGEKTTKVGSGITPTGGAKVYKQEGRPFIRSQNVGWGKLLMDDIAFIDDKTHATFQDTEIEKDDVFLNITGASIGRSAIADARVVGGNVNQHVCIIRTVKNQLHPRFLNYFLLSKVGQQQIDSFQTGGNRQGLNFGQIRSFRVFLPPLLEQEAIAEALSDADAFIEALDGLIAKKRQVKQGAMQELLTGKRRLPRFEKKHGYKQTDLGLIPEDWEVKKLGEIGTSIIGLTYKPTDVRTAGVLVLRSSNIQEGDLRFDDNVFVEMDIPAKLMVKSGDILICVRNGSRELIGKCAYIDERAKGMTFGAFMTVFRTPFHSFVFHQFQSNLLKRQIHEHLGATINQITNKSMNSFIVPMPPTIEEQTAIAEILSDMDAEITALEGKLSKAREVKAGMMSVLLTGRVRLV